MGIRLTEKTAGFCQSSVFGAAKTAVARKRPERKTISLCIVELWLSHKDTYFIRILERKAEKGEMKK